MCYHPAEISIILLFRIGFSAKCHEETDTDHYQCQNNAVGINRFRFEIIFQFPYAKQTVLGHIQCTLNRTGKVLCRKCSQ